MVKAGLYCLLTFFCFSLQAKNSLDKATSITFYQSGTEVAQSKIDLWQRELLTIKIELSSAEEFSYLKPEAVYNQHYITEHAILKTPSINNKPPFVKTILIYIWPLEHGYQQMPLPAVDLMLSGRVLKHIKLLPLAIKVKSLPAYLPPGFPVGKLALDSQYRSESLLPFIISPGNLFNYSLNVSSKGLHRSLLPDYSNYLTSHNIQRLGVSETFETFTADSYYSYNTSLRLPAVTTSSGLQRFDSFKIQSFDPASGKIVSADFNARWLISVPIILQLSLFLIVLSAIYKLFFFFKAVNNKILYRRHLWADVFNSQDAASLSHAIRKLQPDYRWLNTQTHDHGAHQSLSQWARSWHNPALSISAVGLDKLRFSNSTAGDFLEIKAGLIKHLKSDEQCIFYGFISASNGH